jgi:hypothetical protein
MPRVSTHFGLKDPRFQSLVMPMIVPTAISTAGAVTYTAAQLLTGFILRDGNGGARTDTLPTAALLVEAIQGCMVNTAFEFELRNTTATAVSITVAVGTGGTLSGTATVAQLNSKRFLVVVTNITLGSEAYTLYSIGTYLF